MPRHGLVAAGVQPGDRVALYGPNCWEWLVAYYGIAKTGAVVIPLNVMLTTDEVRYVVEDSGARAVVASLDKGEPLARPARSRRARSVVLWGDGDPVRRDGASPTGSRRRAGVRVRSRAHGGDLAAICYTSGTTGRPKGAMQPHRAVIGAAVGTAVMSARGPDDRVINSLPLPHVYGSCVFNAAMMAGLDPDHGPALRRGDRSCARSASTARRSWTACRRPTTTCSPTPTSTSYDLSSLTRCWVGGQTLPAAKSLEFTARTGCPVHEIWGMTELAGATSANPDHRAQQARHDRHPVPRQHDARRRHRRPDARDAGRRARRADVPRTARDARLLRQRARARPRRSSPTAGCTPATSRRWTRTATSRSSTA